MMSIYQMWRNFRGEAPLPLSDDPASMQPMPVVQTALDKTDIATAELIEAITRTTQALLERIRHE